MSEEWAGKTLELHPEDPRFDSGLEESLQSFQDEGLPRFPGTSNPESSLPHQSKTIEQQVEAQDTERIDSSYGSASIIEGLPTAGHPESCPAGTEPTPQTLIEEPAVLVAERVPQTGSVPLDEDIPSAVTEPDPQTAGLPPRGVTRSLSTEHINSFTYLSEEGDTLLHLAVIHNIPELSLYFISLATKDVLDIQNDLYQSALHLAVYLDQQEVVEALLRKDVNLELQDRKGDTALHLACENQHLDCARVLLRGPRGPQNLRLQNWKGLTCLHIATMKKNVHLVSLLLDNGSDINSQEGTSGKTALHLAVEMLDGELVAHILQYRPHVDALMYNGCTALHLAVGRKDIGLSRLLCQAGADILQRNREGDTPQDLAEGNNLLLPLLPFDDLKISGKPVVTTA
ncbi:PREDICTED: NF-kappa-B inhibitor epsilon-like [Nanorana parkeri]|uniref:NF-kappa-B inhibitor epsilon-like n=1 Tax=Nanorana parkeri TaxID=125878 RepID=UPI000854A381|nr:PREDICTED: NF-kappa-B inhibitor epsilon-like [Nanorana parkeri]